MWVKFNNESSVHKVFKKSNIYYLIIENDFMSMRAYWEDGHHAFDRNMIEIV